MTPSHLASVRLDGGHEVHIVVNQLRAPLLKCDVRDVDLGDTLLRSEAKPFEGGASERRRTEQTGVVDDVEEVHLEAEGSREHLRYVAHKLGRLSGLEWVTFKFSEKLRGELQSPLADFVKLDHEAQPTPQLRKLVRQFDSWQKTVEDAERCEHGVACRWLL